jgi:hypothetical protein
MAGKGSGAGEGARGVDPESRTTAEPVGGPAEDHLGRLLADAAGPVDGGEAGSPWEAVLTPEDRDRLAAAIRRRGGNLDVPLAADMVAAVLPEAIASLVVGEASRRRLAERIAATLIEDPRSRGRLEALLAAVRASGDDPGGPRG